MLVKHEFKDNDFLRISTFLEHSNNLFKTSTYIKNFEILNFILHVYKQNIILGKRVRFKSLKLFTTKSDVYLSNLLKSGLESDYLSVHLCPKDKRSRSYQLTQRSLGFIKKLDFEFDLKIDTDEVAENFMTNSSSCPYCLSSEKKVMHS